MSKNELNHRAFWEEGYRVFGLHPINPDGSCGCGNKHCEAAGKHPLVSNWQHTPHWSEDQLDVMEESDQFASGYGVLVRGLFVIDVDARNGGVESYERLVADAPDVAGAGLIVATGSGGGSRHLYFKCDEGLALIQHHPDYKGIDFKSSGFVVGPNSKHVSGNVYKVLYGSPADIDDLPKDIIDGLTKPNRYRAKVDGTTVDVSMGELGDMLNYIPNNDLDYEIWIRIGMALHHASHGEAYDLWRDWSAKSAKHDESNMQKKWHSFGKSANPVTLGTLIYHAEQNGWERPVTFEPDENIGGDYADRTDENVQRSKKPTEWSEPLVLPNGLPEVPPFDVSFLPEKIGPWVYDVADRMQCPIDFVAIPVMGALGALIGSKVGIKPEANTDWLEVPNIWGIVVGRPGAMKSPAMSEALNPIRNLEKEAARKNAEAFGEYELALKVYEKQRQGLDKKLEKALEKGEDIEPIKKQMAELKEPKEPRARRYVVSDTTYEKLGEIAAKNPQGVLVHRDELVGLISDLSKEENASARGFYLQAWTGTSPYVFDRIVRGKIDIENACISLLGTTQPAKLAQLMHAANTGSKLDDGLMQRFGLLIWPEQGAEWKSSDRAANTQARENAASVFVELNAISGKDIASGAFSVSDKIDYLRFDDEARKAFVEWRIPFEKKLRSGQLSPALESHLSKYRKLIPTLALIIYLADGGRKAVDLASLKKALAFADYLEAHAIRCYSSGTVHVVAAAKSILRRIKKGDLKDGFSARQIYNSGWSGLNDTETVKSALEMLTELNWLLEIRHKNQTVGGRPKTTYKINPRAKKS